ncbi:MAG: hypothetical protein N2491_12005 [Negativicutes bacterium]|nr:hypothetical protein [Negativicutes bacterium]
MISKSEQQLQACEQEVAATYTSNDADWYAAEDEEDWKRLLRYIGAAVLFFYILFKYLI